MAKNKSKKVFQEAIKAELLNEGFFDQKIADPISGIAQGIANVPRAIAGQVRLGQVNSKLKKTTNRMQKDWQQAREYAGQKSEKMKNSKNQQVARFGHQIDRNFQNLDATMNQAFQQLENLAALGSDTNMGAFPPVEKYSKDGTANFGFEKWIKSSGADPKALKKGNMYGNFLFAYMAMLQKGIDPSQIEPRELYLRLRQVSPDGESINQETAAAVVDQAIEDNGLAPQQPKQQPQQAFGFEDISDQVPPPPPKRPAMQNPQRQKKMAPPPPPKQTQQQTEKMSISGIKNPKLKRKIIQKLRSHLDQKREKIPVSVPQPPVQQAQGETEAAPIPLVKKKEPQVQPLSLSQMHNLLPTIEDAPNETEQPAQKQQQPKKGFRLLPKAGLSLSQAYSDAEQAAKKRLETPYEPKKKSAPSPQINDQGEIQIGDSSTGESGLYPSKDNFESAEKKGKKRPSAKRRK